MKNYLFVMPKGAAKSSGGYNVFPIGIAYVTSYLKQYNAFNIFTANLEFINKSTTDSLTALITKNNIDVLCVGGLSRDYNRINEVIDVSKRINSNIIIVVGGGIISGDPEPAMQALQGADIGVVGQGEITMYELAVALNNNKSLENIAGLIYKDLTGYIKTEPRQDIKDLDSLPFPDYEGFSFDKYLETINYEATYLIASRSCPYKCTFCFHPSGHMYRQRSLDNIFAEIDYLLKIFPIKKIVISDELFAPNRKRVLAFCHKIKPYKIPWDVQLRVSDVDNSFLHIMKDSGCSSISYGIESLDSNVLESMRKNITVPQIERALKLTYEAYLEIQGGLIFGDIAETKETSANSLRWWSKHLHYGLELNMINIFPGTGLYNYAVLNKIITDKVQFLKDGCPLINVSKLSNEEYKDLASNIYTRNMKAKYLPEVYSIKYIKNDLCQVSMICNRCKTEQQFFSDLLHIKRVRCSSCYQRYYIDPFLKIKKNKEYVNDFFNNDHKIALWGAGEICIKLLDNYSIFQHNRVSVVDISKSRQGYIICGKKIKAPTTIFREKISTIVITVIRRKQEILTQLKKYNNVKNAYLPFVNEFLELTFKPAFPTNNNSDGNKTGTFHSAHGRLESVPLLVSTP